MSPSASQLAELVGHWRIEDFGCRVRNGQLDRERPQQFERAKKNGWIKTFKSAATYQFPPEVLMAIASRETNMRNIIGDGGHGYGLVQIDDRSFPEWCNSGLWKGRMPESKRGLSSFTASNKPFGMGRVSRFEWVAGRLLESKPQQGRSPPNRRCSL